MKNIVRVGCFVWGSFLLPPLVFGSEVGSSADLYSSKSFSVGVLANVVERDVTMKIGGGQEIQIPTSGGNSTVFSESNTEKEMESESKEIVLKAAFRPRDGLMYFGKIGTVRGFELAYSSGSYTNRFQGEDSGFLWGFGFRWNITQDTPVSAAIAFEVSYQQAVVDLEAFKSGGVTSSVNDRFLQDEFQGAVNLSKRFGTLQPYGGLKLLRIESNLKDGQTQGKISGSDNLVSPFVGFQWEVFEKEFLVLESSFVGEQRTTMGFRTNF